MLWIGTEFHAGSGVHRTAPEIALELGDANDALRHRPGMGADAHVEAVQTSLLARQGLCPGGIIGRRRELLAQAGHQIDIPCGQGKLRHKASNQYRPFHPHCPHGWKLADQCTPSACFVPHKATPWNSSSAPSLPRTWPNWSGWHAGPMVPVDVDGRGSRPSTSIAASGQSFE